MKIILDNDLFQLHFVNWTFDSKNKNFESADDEYVLTPEDVKFVNSGLDYYEKILRELKLDFSLRYIVNIRERLKTPINYGQFSSELDILTHRIEHELEKLVFGYIPIEKVDCFQQEELFGKEVFDNFPSAREEIKEAGTCYAHGTYTATVFHLMRAVEVGAKAMVYEMKADKHITTDVVVKGQKKKKKIPIELCDWQKLIGGLNKALVELEKGKATNLRKKETHAYFSQAVFQFSTMKDAWRNIISHGHEVAENRKLYLEGETKDIMNNARQFLQHLAKRVKEKPTK